MVNVKTDPEFACHEQHGSQYGAVKCIQPIDLRIRQNFVHRAEDKHEYQQRQNILTDLPGQCMPWHNEVNNATDDKRHDEHKGEAHEQRKKQVPERAATH